MGHVLSTELFGLIFDIVKLCICCSAPEDLDRSEHLRLLLEDLQNVRQDKIRNGLAKIAGDVQAGETAFVIQMNNISAMEINSVREFMLGVRSAVVVDKRAALEWWRLKLCVLLLYSLSISFIDFRNSQQERVPVRSIGLDSSG